MCVCGGGVGQIFNIFSAFILRLLVLNLLFNTL